MTTSKRKLKIALLSLFRAVGGFHLCRSLFRRRLRILCYHGLSVADEYRLDDILFMRPETFRRRMRLLAKWKLKVIPLEQAVHELPGDRHPDFATVITFDDGWRSTLLAGPVLKEQGYPATVYVATHYVSVDAPVFNVQLRYLYWKSGQPWEPGSECHEVMARANGFSDAEKTKLLEETARLFGIDPEPIALDRRFHYLTIPELRGLPDHGIALGLHTDRHELPDSETGIAEDVAENRRVLERARPGKYEHFCYPSGLFREEQLPWLSSAGIQSATTTRHGFNTPRTPLLKLDRFLDRDQLTEVEFEAAICGVGELVSFLR